MKVRIKLRFRGRQKAHKEIGYEVINKFVADLALYGQADSPPKMLGDRDLNVILSPLPRNKRAKNPREAEAPAKETRTPTAAPAPTPPPASESAVLPAPGGQNAG
jgi:translation initiation factor IF-3